MRSPRVLAVDIGAGHVACGVFTVGAAGRLVLQQVAIEPHSSDPANEGRWALEIAQSLGAAATRNRISGAAAIAVPGHLALTKFIKTPSVAKEKRGKMVAFEAAENIPYPLEEVVWDYVVVSDDGFDIEVMLAAAKFDAMQGLCGAADSADFPVERATPAGMALCHAFRYNYPDVNDPVIVLNVGARSTNLLFVEGERFYLRTLAMGGNFVTQTIADELRIDFASAETLKIQVLSGKSDLPMSSPSRSAVQKAASAFATRLTLEVTRSAVNHRRLTGGSAATAVYITGGGSLIEEMVPTMAEKLRVRVERYQPLKNVDLAADARAMGVESSAQVLADLVGLATRLVAKNEAEASLLPPTLQAVLAFRKRQPKLMVAAILAVLALAPPIWYFHRVTTATLERVADVSKPLMQLRSLQNRNEDNTRQIQEAVKQISALQGAYDTKANWINFFADLQTRLVKVEDVWLDTLQIVHTPLPDPSAAPEPPPQDNNQQPAPDGSTPMPPKPPMLLNVSGRLLDVANPQSRVSQASMQRVNELLKSFTGSQFIAAVEKPRFDTSQPGLLKFDFTLVINPKKPL